VFQVLLLLYLLLPHLRDIQQLSNRSQEIDPNNMNFDELILEAAKKIAAATSALIKAASEAQKELVSQGKLQKVSSIHSEDGQWSEGLVSAARLVAAATHSLCEAANALVI
jgi:talin